MFSVKASALSDVGKTRRFNEDFFAISHDHRLFIVADGMGGHGNGEVASRLVVRAVREHFDEKEPASSRKRAAEARSGARTERLVAAVRAANQRVLGEVEKDRALVGMGTTLVALMMDDGIVTVGHVGDSRAYRLRDGQLELLTNDHTWVNEQVTAGNISESQARNHPFKSVVTRALGGDREVEVEIRELQVSPGDLYLLCSDGLSSMVPDELIRERLASGRDLEEICRDLVEEANGQGGRDNVTVIVVQVQG
jgi:PPM family protein phosphatase